MAPFTARSPSSASSILTTLDGGVARGYAGIPQVERAIAVHLCPRNAATWRNCPRLPSKACKLTAALAAKAYSAAAQAASALHAMAILQVHQAKALKQVHEGSTDPGLMQELRTATDFALRATKVTARSLGKAMSTMVVQERHLWLNLVEMKDVDKAHFLDAPISSVCPSPWAPSCILQSCSAPGRIDTLAGASSLSQESSAPCVPARPQVVQEVDEAALTQATRRCWNLLFPRRRREQRRSFPWWRAGRRIFRLCSLIPTFSRKSNFLFLWVLRSMGRQCATPCFLTLVSHDSFCQ